MGFVRLPSLSSFFVVQLFTPQTAYTVMVAILVLAPFFEPTLRMVLFWGSWCGYMDRTMATQASELLQVTGIER